MSDTYYAATIMVLHLDPSISLMKQHVLSTCTTHALSHSHLSRNITKTTFLQLANTTSK